MRGKMERCGYGVVMIDVGLGDEAIFTCEREICEEEAGMRGRGFRKEIDI